MLKYFFILFLYFPGSSKTQEITTGVQLSHYVFDAFDSGTVQVKSGIVSRQLLNYNILTGEMIFEDGGKLLAIGNPADVDSIHIRGRKFVPINNRFYEVLTDTKVPLLLDFIFSIEEPGASVGYGVASPSTNATSLKTLIGTGSVYLIKLPEDFKVTPGISFWLRKDGQMMKAGSAQQIMKVFPGKKDQIKALIKKNNTNFSNRKDLAAIVQQIQE